MIKIIMKYFTCEGRFSGIYTYPIWLLMHFTMVKMLNIPYFLFQDIDKMAYIFQKREYENKMKSIFHHSHIKIIILHHLKQLNISWSTFITNDIFTDLFIQHVKYVPSSSHPSTSIPSYQPTIRASSSDRFPSPSPFHEHIKSPSKAETSEPEKTNQVEVIQPKRDDLGILSHTYQRGHRPVFAPHIVGGALRSSPSKKVHKGKEKITEVDIQEDIHEEENLYEIEVDFDHIDSYQNDHDASLIIKERYGYIREL